MNQNLVMKLKISVLKARKLLADNSEWKTRYAKYAKKIAENIATIKANKKMFHQWSPLYLYMNVGNAKSGGSLFAFRYVGQDVANLKISDGKKILKVSEEQKTNNLRDFACAVNVDGEEWRSSQGTKFRNYFKSNPKRSRDGKGNEEHRVESLFLTELSKRKKIEKNPMVHNIQPVKLAGLARFQLPTPFAAAGFELKYAAERGGGIDILARVGVGKGTTLCICEVKDEYSKNEPPEEAITQAVEYATFVRELLRSESGESWWHLFGFGGKVPQKLKLLVSCIMPFADEKNSSDKSFAKEIVEIEEDKLELHYIYFQEQDATIKHVETSIRR